MLAKIEVSFLERYRGQACFRDIDALMASSGFELIDFYRLKRYRRKNELGVGNVSLGRGQRAGRLAYGDALFMLRQDKLLARIHAEGWTTALKAILGLMVYGKADLAAALFEASAAQFEPDRRTRIAKYLSSVRGHRRNLLHHAVDYLARQV